MAKCIWNWRINVEAVFREKDDRKRSRKVKEKMDMIENKYHNTQLLLLLLLLLLLPERNQLAFPFPNIYLFIYESKIESIITYRNSAISPMNFEPACY